jgi:hypothetical protein
MSGSKFSISSLLAADHVIGKLAEFRAVAVLHPTSFLKSSPAWSGGASVHDILWSTQAELRMRVVFDMSFEESVRALELEKEEAGILSQILVSPK